MKYFGHTVIPDLEGNYLTEIVDFDNSNVNKEITLLIPSASWENPNWHGLEGDTKYKFRLDASCPLGSEQYVTSHFEFIMQTNKPPVPGIIEVFMSTFFKYEIELFSRMLFLKHISLKTPLNLK